MYYLATWPPVRQGSSSGPPDPPGHHGLAGDFNFRRFWIAGDHQRPSDLACLVTSTAGVSIEHDRRNGHPFTVTSTVSGSPPSLSQADPVGAVAKCQWPTGRKSHRQERIQDDGSEQDR